MRWNIKNTWSWWKNLLTISRKNNYINSIFNSAISSFLLVAIIFKINLPITISLLTAICFINIVNVKYWILFLSFFSILFVSLLIYNFIFLNYENINLNGDFELTKKFKNILIFKYKNIYFKVSTKNNQFEIPFDFENKSIFHLEGKLKRILNLSLFELRNNLFFKLEYQSINHIITLPNENIIFHRNSIVKNYLNIIILNKYSYTNSIYQKLLDLNIIHFFTISGFHFNLIYIFFNFIFKKIKIKEPYNQTISILILLIYILILGYKISAIRAFLFIFLSFLNKNILKNKFRSLSILSISALIVSSYYPYSFFSNSFILTYLITSTILIFNFCLKNQNFYLKNGIIILITHLFSVLIIHNFQEKYNIFSILIQIIVSPLISVNFILSIILFKASWLIEKIVVFLDLFLDLINKSSFYLYFKTPEYVWVFWLLMSSVIYKIKTLKSQSKGVLFIN